MNEIRNEDCRITLQSKIEYDYVFTSPPDFDELGFDPRNEVEYQQFLFSVFSLCQPTTGVVTVAFTDRKFNSRIIPKSHMIKNVMFSIGCKLISHKILVKSTGINMFRLNFMNVLSFGKGKIKQNLHKDFKPDVWMDGTERYENYPYGMPVNVPKRCILNYTKEGQVVYDPFMGSGTTAIAAIRCGRRWLGSEINPDYCNLSKERISEIKNSQIVIDSQ